MIHDGIALQQLVLENSGQEPVCFGYTLKTDALIRDLDLLDASYTFNEDLGADSTYKHVPGPNGYGHACVHEYESPSPVGKPDDQTAQHSSSTSDPVSQNPPQEPEVGKTVRPEEQESARLRPGTAGGAQNGVLSSVAAVTTLFRNGEAVKMSNNTLIARHTLEGHDFVEFVVAYKIISLPPSRVHWENFIVTADEADVNKILRKESEDLWGYSDTEDEPLCSLGISMMDLSERMGERAAVDSGEAEGLSRVTPNSILVKEEAYCGASTSVSQGDPEKIKSDPTRNAGADSASQREKISFPSGLLRGSSPKNHIEYIVWRHLEHILSVCAIPLSTLPLKLGNGDKEHRNIYDTALVALTCGDMSCHRVSTSASL